VVRVRGRKGMQKDPRQRLDIMDSQEPVPSRVPHLLFSPPLEVGIVAGDPDNCGQTMQLWVSV
jgi:hypothetical protein